MRHLLVLLALVVVTGCKNEPRHHHIAGLEVTAPGHWDAELERDEDSAQLTFDSWLDDGLCMVQVLEADVPPPVYFETMSQQFGGARASGTKHETRMLQSPLGNLVGIAYRGRVPDTGGVVGSVAKLAGPVRLEHYALSQGDRLVTGTLMTFEDDQRAAEKMRKKCHAVLQSLRPAGVALEVP